MSSELRFDGRVAIVTGAGNGLGRAYALLLASRGAKVVVNDLGGAAAGGGQSTQAADRVVAEIRAAGGEAVPNYDSVEEGGTIVDTAVQAFGRLDIVINNAGILRDVSFAKMTEEDWDRVYRVHLHGAFSVTRAAWPILRDQGYGRVIMTASAAGIYGNFGQSNYSAMKLGLVGFGNTLAIEGQKRNVLVNTVAPAAASRLTESVFPPDLFEALDPRYVAVLVARLCHESSAETGGVFEVGGGFYAKLRWERARGKVFRLGRSVSVEDVDRSWLEITSFDESSHPAGGIEAMTPIVENVQAGRSRGGNEFIDVDEALGANTPDVVTSYDERDLAIYALGIGAARDPRDERELRHVYELHSSGMKPLPSFAVIPAMNAMFANVKAGKQPAGLHYGFDRVLHGEQYTELKRPLPTSAKLTHRFRVKDIWDKGRGAVVVTEIRSFDDSGEELVRNEFTAFVRGAGGWGGERGPSAETNVPPEREADAIVEEKIPDNQALLYRLSGDWNPLHADPSFAGAMGFERPILHGLCSFGYATRHVAGKFARDGNPDHVKSIKVRFADNVLPGETLVTEIWRDGDLRVVFRCRVKERDRVVISNAAIEFYDQIPVAEAKPAQATAPDAQAEARTFSDAPSSRDLFVAMADHVSRHPELVKQVGHVYLFRLKEPAGVWTVNLKDGSGSVDEGESGKPECVIDISARDFLDMSSGKADPFKLFSQGRLRITGNVMASQKLTFLKDVDPAASKQAIEKARSNGTAAPAVPAKGREPIAPSVFDALAKLFALNGNLGNEVRGSCQFVIIEPDSAWLADLTEAGPKLERGKKKGATTTLTLSDEALGELASGKTTVNELYQHGRLRLDGDVLLAHRLSFMTKLLDR